MYAYIYIVLFIFLCFLPCRFKYGTKLHKTKIMLAHLRKIMPKEQFKIHSFWGGFAYSKLSQGSNMNITFSSEKVILIIGQNKMIHQGLRD